MTDEPSRKFSVLLGCYGDYSQYSLRALRSVLNGRRAGPEFEVLVGLSACGRSTTAECRRLLDAGEVDALVESRVNVNKDPMMRVLLERVRTPYFVWLDDDSHFLRDDWAEKLGRFIEAEKPFDAAGHVFFWHSPTDPAHPLRRFIARKPWWAGWGCGRRGADDTRVFFPTGGLFVARTAFCRLHGFPDYAMVKKQDDIIFGELLDQTGARLVQFPAAVMDCLRISDGDRRGGGEADEDFLRCDPRTGAVRQVRLHNKVTETSPVVVHAVSPTRGSDAWRTLLSNRSLLGVVGDDDVEVLTVNTSESPCLVEQQFDASGIPLTVLGRGQTPFRPSMKLELYRKALARPGRRYALLLDGYDVLVNGRLGDLVDALRRKQLGVLYNAERTNYPPDAPNSRLEEQRAPADSPYRYLNSGVCVGLRSELVRLFDRCLVEAARCPCAGDQYLLKAVYPQCDGVGLDWQAEVFQCFSFGHSPEADLRVEVVETL
jgi:hypothetical protein